MAPEVLPDHPRPWPWSQLAVALGAFPVSFILWLVGMDAALGSAHNPNPIGEVCLVASPFVAIAGALWLWVLVVRKFVTSRRRWISLSVGVPSLALGLFLGLAAFFEPPGAYGVAVLSGIMLFVGLGCVLYAWAEAPARPAAQSPGQPAAPAEDH
jgi:hypothetical protein